MNKNGILFKNELEANRFAAKIMLATILFVLLTYVLDLVKIFIVPVPIMTVALSIATILLLLPSFIVFILKIEAPWVKYVIVSAAALMVSFLSAYLSYHVVILYIYAVAIASLYFSRALSWYAVLLSVSALTVSQIASLYSGGVTDNNAKVFKDMLVYTTAPRGIELVALSLIFIALAKRTRKLLENVMGAEEQKTMLDRMMTISNKSLEVSGVLSDSLEQLSAITELTTNSNEMIVENTGKIAYGSEETLKFVDEAASTVIDISENIKRIAEESKKMEQISEQVKQMTEINRSIMKIAAEDMSSLNQVTAEGKEIIHSLGERSNQIGKIVEVIKGISGQTNLLALNAAIESARAGEHGKGFAVVASEIRALAEQSEKAAKDITNLVKVVLEDTQRAVESMDNSSKMVENGLEVMTKAGESFEQVSQASKEMNDKVQEVSNITSNTAKDGDKIVNIVQSISEINHKTIEEIQNIAIASKEQLDSMQQVTASVGTIEKIAVELIDTVKEK